MTEALHGSAPPDSTERRFVTAVLRRRARWLRQTLQPKTLAAVRFLPVLLQGSFHYPQLKTEAPGVRGMGFRPGWGKLAAAVGLQPPYAMQRSRSLIDTILILPQDARSALAIVLHSASKPEEQRLVDDRTAALQPLLEKSGVRLFSLPVREANPQQLRRVLAFGALIAGSFPLEAVALADSPEGDSRALAAQAPAQLSAIALLLIDGAPLPSPVGAMIDARQRGVTARELADPARFTVEWTARMSGAGPLLRAALRLSRGDSESMELQPVLALSEKLWARLVRVTRSAPGLRAELLGPATLRLLLPAIAKRLPGKPLELQQEGRRWLAVMGDEVIARGGTQKLAHVRALALLGAAEGQPVKSTGVWNLLSAELAKGQPFCALVVGARSVSGPPFDPLNRGPGRELCLKDSLLVRIRPGCRPTAADLPDRAAVVQLAAAAQRRERVEIFAQTPEAQPAVARLSRIAALLSSGKASACEIGGEILVAREGRLRRVQPRKFLARPQFCAVDPEAPDLAFSPERPLDVRGATAIIQCRVDLQGGTAVLLYEDARGARFREEVPLPSLEAHLEETQAMLRVLTPQFAVALRTGHDVEQAVRTANPPPRLATITIAGALPGPITLEIAGRSFNGGVDSAALQIAADWPVGQRGRIAVQYQPGRADPLLALYTRSSVLRRLHSRLARISL
jgi:hypothetical protein